MSEQDDSPKKAMSFKDRIAMFNQPKAAAPAPGPPPRATKPRTFKWKTSGESDEGSSKTVAVADVPPPAPTPTPDAKPAASAEADTETSAALTDKPGAPNRAASTSSGSGAPLEATSSRASVISAEDSIKHKGFSAEDAKQTAGSLKERIALLSGLKVDKPDAPGRAPKPWRKKTQEPGGNEQPQKASESDVRQHAESPNADSASTEPTVVVETDKTSSVHQDSETATEDSPGNAPEGAASLSDKNASTPEPHGVALPAMPTRARGPQRKGRTGGATNAAVASPASQSPVTEAPKSPLPADEESHPAVPSVSEIGSPAAGPEELGDPISASGIQQRKDEKGEEAPGALEEKDTESLSGSQASMRSPPKRASTSLIAQSVPLPPPTTSSGTTESRERIEAEEGEDGSEIPGAKQLNVESADVESLSASMSKQSLNSQEAPISPIAAVSSPVARPPAPPALNTQLGASPPNVASSPTDVTSPTSANTNRRSMTRPPVPSGYSQDSPLPSASPRSSFDNRSQRSSIVDSNRASLVMSPTQPEQVSAEPESLAGDGEFANPALDGKEKEVLPPPVSKPFNTEQAQNTQEKPSVEGKGAVRETQPRRQSGILTSSAEGGTAPARTASMASRKSATGMSAESVEEPETNISAMRAYRAPPQEETDDKGDEEEEEYEDPEVARRQALAKRMAAMGGMKIGMLPQMPSMMKKKKPQESEAEVAEATTAAPLGSPPPFAPQTSRSTEDDGPSRPPAQSQPSFRPPAGAFVLPMPGRPPVPPPAVPPPPAPDTDEEIDNDDDDQHESLEQDEDGGQEAAYNKEEEAASAGDDTVTQELQDDQESDENLEEPPLTPMAPPPPVPSARPPPPPPVQSFIETDTDTDGGRSDKRTSMTSSTGMGSLSDFPAPPAGEGHVRTVSGASSLLPPDQSETLHEEPESVEEYDGRSEQTETLLPPRPARRAPTLDTSVERTTADEGGRAPSRRESTAEPASPSQSVHSYSQRSLPETPVSPSGRGSGQERYGALSPTASQSSRRSSALLSGQQAGGPAPTPGLNHDYLAYIAHNSSKSKSREVDGPLAHTLNDIAYTYRSDPANFGTTVWRMYNPGVKGQMPELEIHGRIDAGCVFFAWDAKFDRGLGRSSPKVGSAEVPHVGVVAEGVKDIKKAKVKVVELVQGRHNVETYKLDDLKSGTVEIRRLA